MLIKIQIVNFFSFRLKKKRCLFPSLRETRTLFGDHNYSFFSIVFLVHGRYLQRIRLFIILGSWHTHRWSISCCCCLIAKTCVTLWAIMDYTPSGSSIHRISQARILEGSTIPFSRGSSQPKDQTYISYTAGRFCTTKPPGKPWPISGSLLLTYSFMYS